MPAARIGRWFENFATRHGEVTLAVRAGLLAATAGDGTRAEAALPLGREYAGPADVAHFREAMAVDACWGVLLVRKGGFAVAAMQGERLLASKVGSRHVQGRTKAGGQSQQRFARRRDNQARAAYAAAADHAHRVLTTGGEPTALACGGDRRAVDEVLDDPRLAVLAPLRTGVWLAVPDPRRDVLERAVADALSAVVTLPE